MKIHLWRYKENRRNYPGYHLTADRQGCEFLLSELLKVKNDLIVSLQPITPEILEVPNNNGGVVDFSHLAIHTKTSFPPEHFIFSEQHPRISLECSRSQIQCIASGMEDLKEDKGDYCIGGDGDQVVWFWWYPKISKVEPSAPANRAGRGR